MILRDSTKMNMTMENLLRRINNKVLGLEKLPTYGYSENFFKALNQFLTFKVNSMTMSSNSYFAIEICEVNNEPEYDDYDGPLHNVDMPDYYYQVTIRKFTKESEKDKRPSSIYEYYINEDLEVGVVSDSHYYELTPPTTETNLIIYSIMEILSKLAFEPVSNLERNYQTTMLYSFSDSEILESYFKDQLIVKADNKEMVMEKALEIATSENPEVYLQGLKDKFNRIVDRWEESKKDMASALKNAGTEFLFSRDPDKLIKSDFKVRIDGKMLAGIHYTSSVTVDIDIKNKMVLTSYKDCDRKDIVKKFYFNNPFALDIKVEKDRENIYAIIYAGIACSGLYDHLLDRNWSNYRFVHYELATSVCNIIEGE